MSRSLPYDTWASRYDEIYAAAGKDYAAEAAYLVNLVKSRVPEATTWLDVACGTGQHLRCLAPHYSCVGVDINPELAAIAQARSPHTPVVVADMRRFAFARSFDVVSCLFSAIGHATTLEELSGTVATMAAHAEHLLLIETWYAPGDTGRYRPALLQSATSECHITRRVEIVEHGTTCTFAVSLETLDPTGVACVSESFELGLFTIDEYVDAVACAGFSAYFDPAALSGRGLIVATRR